MDNERRGFPTRDASSAAGVIIHHEGGISMEFVKLNNDVSMPILGYGTFQITDEKSVKMCPGCN